MCSSDLASASIHYLEHLEAQGNIIYNDLDPYTLAGGVGGQPVDLQMPALVTDGVLRVYARRRDQYGGSGDDTATTLPAILVQPDPNATPHITINPAPWSLTPAQAQQFYCVGWYIGDSCSWAVTSGPGSITSGGLYTAPAAGYDPPPPVTVTATSATDGTISAAITFNLVLGPMSVVPASPTIDRGLSVAFQSQINGIAYPNVSWSLSPAVGTIDALGAYTAPDTVAADTQVTVSAISTDNASHTASTVLTVRKTMPAIHIAPGMEYPNTVTDSAGTVWTLGTAYFTCTGGDCYPGPAANHSVAAAYAQFDQSTELEVSSKTKLIWDGVQRGSAYEDPPHGDFQYLFPVPNGQYSVYLAFNTAGAYDVVNGDKEDIWVNGVKWLSGWDTVTDCGVNIACSPPGYSVTVTNRQILLQFKGAYIGLAVAPNYRGGVPAITAIQIYDASGVPPTLRPDPPLCDAGVPQSSGGLSGATGRVRLARPGRRISAAVFLATTLRPQPHEVVQRGRRVQPELLPVHGFLQFFTWDRALAASLRLLDALGETVDSTPGRGPNFRVCLAPAFPSGAGVDFPGILRPPHSGEFHL